MAHGAEALEVADLVRAVRANSREVPRVVHVVGAVMRRARNVDRGERVSARIVDHVLRVIVHFDREARVNVRLGRGEKAIVRIARVEMVRGQADRRVVVIVRIARVVKVGGRLGRLEMVSGRQCRVEMVSGRIVRVGKVSGRNDRGELGSGLINRGKKEIVRFARVVKVSARGDRRVVVIVRIARGRKVMGKSVAAARVAAAQASEVLENVLVIVVRVEMVSVRHDRGENSIVRLDPSEVIVRNDRSPMRSVVRTKFVAQRVVASTSAAKFPTSAQVKSDGSMRVQFAHGSPRSGANRNPFVSAQAKRWRRSTPVRSVRSPQRSANAMGFVKHAA